MPKYLIGYSANAWSFEAAYQSAQDGDTLELEKGYVFHPKNSYFTIAKSLSIVGVIEKVDKHTTFHCTLSGKYIIDKKAKVTFQNIWFETDQSQANIVVQGGAQVDISKAVLTNDTTEKNAFTMFVTGNSVVTCRDLEIKVKQDPALKVTDSSKLKILDSYLRARIICDKESDLELSKTTVEFYDSNVIHARHASLDFNKVTIKGGNTEKGYPAVWMARSVLKMVDSIVEQPRYASAVNLTDSSGLEAQRSTLSSVNLHESRAILTGVTLGVQLGVSAHSSVYATEGLAFKGEFDEKIDLYVDGGSQAFLEQVTVNRSINPNIRIKEGSHVRVGQLLYPGGDIASVKQEVAEGSSLTIAKQTSQTLVKSENGQTVDALEELNQLVGLNKVKKKIANMISMVDYNNIRVEKGLTPEKPVLHATFMGNPGTGKTTVARLIGQVLHEKGALSGDGLTFIEVTEADLISSNVGQTAIQTKALLEKARGGILFIDEAYTLNKQGRSVDFGIEAINTILKYMEDYRDEIMIIFAGYTKEMEQFLKTNPGLKSRIPNTFDFEDYTGEEIAAMGLQLLQKGAYQLEDEAYYRSAVQRAYRNSLDKSNGRWIRNFYGQLIESQAGRVMAEGSDDVITIKNQDIDAVLNIGKFDKDSPKEDAHQRLKQLIGIKRVKSQVEEFISIADINRRREEVGEEAGDFSLHSLFLGNPGTGKTTVARIIGDILYQKGLIKDSKFIEVSRSDLVGQYIGQTAQKTREVLESALGGVLFIDEAYTLSSGTSNDFGPEAINEILKFMEDHRRDIVIIFAGYTKEMSEFLQVNSGLSSRIPNVFDFEDYSPDEIVQIGLLGLKGYTVDEDSYADIVRNAYLKTNDHSNGRWVRNFNEKLIRVMASRLSKVDSNDREFLKTITSDDLEKVKGD